MSQPNAPNPSAYCDPADVRAPGATPTQIADGIADASAEIDTYLAKKYKLPLIQSGADLRGACRRMARYYAFADRGFDPANAGDQAIVKGYNDSVAWLKEVAKPDGTAELVGAIDSSPSVEEDAPIHEGEAPRRWLWGSRASGEDC
jgi:phage gp36-like protein